MINPVEQKNKDSVSVVSQNEAYKNVKFLGRIQLKKGQTLYEINYNTGEVKEAEFMNDKTFFADLQKSLNPRQKKLIVKENCIYVLALNRKNAIRKFNNEIKKLQGRAVASSPVS